MISRAAARLLEAVRTVAPTAESVSVGRKGEPATVRVHPAVLQALAQPIIDSFDWSDRAEREWEDDRKPRRKAQRSSAANASELAILTAYRANQTPTQRETEAALKIIIGKVLVNEARLAEID